MVQKMETSGKLEQEQEVLLYILILELKEDWKAGLEVLNGPLGNKLAKSASYRNFCFSKRVEFHLASEDWEEVANLAREELDRLPERWSAYTQFISAVKELQGKDAPSKYTTEKAEQFILSQQSTHPQAIQVRPADCRAVDTPGLTHRFSDLVQDGTVCGDVVRLDRFGVCGGNGKTCGQKRYGWRSSGLQAKCSATCGGGRRVTTHYCQHIQASRKVHFGFYDPKPPTTHSRGEVIKRLHWITGGGGNLLMVP